MILILIIFLSVFSVNTVHILKEHHPVNQVHITQVASQKHPFHPGAHPSRKTRRSPRKPPQKDISLESDADPVFSLDDFTDDCEPFFESEEDDLSSSGENVDVFGINKLFEFLRV